MAQVNRQLEVTAFIEEMNKWSEDFDRLTDLTPEQIKELVHATSLLNQQFTAGLIGWLNVLQEKSDDGRY